MYLALGSGLFVLTASSKPDDGMEWIPFMVLGGSWWYRMHPSLMIPGYFVNAAVLYLTGWLIEAQWRRVRAGGSVK